MIGALVPKAKDGLVFFGLVYARTTVSFFFLFIDKAEARRERIEYSANPTQTLANRREPRPYQSKRISHRQTHHRQRKMDAQQSLPTTSVTTEMALRAIVRIAKALQKEAQVTADFEANLPAICDKPRCLVCDPSVRRIRFRPQEGSNKIGRASCRERVF